MYWIWVIIVGAVVGALGRLFHPGVDPMGWILTILLGIAGAWLGSLLYAGRGFIGFIISIVCAVVLLFIYEMIRKNKSNRSA